MCLLFVVPSMLEEQGGDSQAGVAYNWPALNSEKHLQI